MPRLFSRHLISLLDAPAAAVNISVAVLLLCAVPLQSTANSPPSPLHQLVNPLLTEHPGKSGLFVLEKGETALLSRAWMIDHAEHRIDIQYFIWSTDNIGILAAEALLRAADRGVSVRVIVDDLMIDAENTTLLALAHHPQVDIRVYNPRHRVGTSTLQRIRNLLFDFRGSNQRMHDKTVTVDGHVAITGGRNMADEYYDYNQQFNFRDRDALLVGPVVAEMERSFERFWESPLTMSVIDLLADQTPLLTADQITAHYRYLHAYAADPANYTAEVRNALANLDQKFTDVIAETRWGDILFLSDAPGKNDGSSGLGGGGLTTTALTQAVASAEQRITIQSPYLVIPEGGMELFAALIRRGVTVRIHTNSLAATDNLLAFSGYARQRQRLRQIGIQLFEYKPDPEIQRRLVDRYAALRAHAPLFAVHAKTLVVDGNTLYIGTFNLDPRSANLNTEVGVLTENHHIAAEVEAAIERDMLPGNSWQPTETNSDQHAPWSKRLPLQLLKLLPLEPVL